MTVTTSITTDPRQTKARQIAATKGAVTIRQFVGIMLVQSQSDPSKPRYTVDAFNCFQCNCPDSLSFSGRCKHAQAARLVNDAINRARAAWDGKTFKDEEDQDIEGAAIAAIICTDATPEERQEAEIFRRACEYVRREKEQGVTTEPTAKFEGAEDIIALLYGEAA